MSEDTLEKTFKLFDNDENGFITLDELKESMPIEITSKIEWIVLLMKLTKMIMDKYPLMNLKT